MKYKYRARSKSGILSRGIVEADNELEARRKVLDISDFIIDIEQKGSFFSSYFDRINAKLEEIELERDRKREEKQKLKEKKKKETPKMDEDEFSFVKDLLRSRLTELGYGESSINEGLNSLNRFDYDLEYMCYVLGLDDIEYKKIRKEVLFSSGHKVLGINEFLQSISFQRGVSTRDLIEFTEQLSILIRNGVNMTDAIHTIKQYTGSKRLKQVLHRVEDRLREGYTLSRSLHEHSDVFSTFYISLVELGEETGVIEDTLLDVIKMLNINHKVKSELKKVLVYPVILMVGLLGFLFVAKFFLIPQFREMFDSMGAELPLLTRMLFAFSDHVTFYLVLIAVIALAIFQAARKSDFIKKRLRLFMDRMLLKIYPFKDSFMLMNVLQLTSSLHISMKNGITLNKSIMLAEKAVMNTVFKEELTEVLLKVEEGRKLSDAIKDVDLFYNNFKASVFTGEKSGELEQVLGNLQEKYEDDLQMNIDILLSALQPLSLGVAGAFLLPVLLGLYGPILEMTNTIGSM